MATTLYDFATVAMGKRGEPEPRQAQEHIEEYVVDFSAQSLAQTDSNRYVALLQKIEADVLVTEVEAIILKAEGEAATGQIGVVGADGAAVDDDGFLKDLDLNATAGTIKSSRTQTAQSTTEEPYTVTRPAYADGVLIAGTVAAPKYVSLVNTNANTANVGKVLVRIHSRRFSDL